MLCLSAYIVFVLGFSSTRATAQDQVAIDVKTPLESKTELAPAKAGAAMCLHRSEWATISEVGEDYSLWLKEYERVKDGRDTRAELTIELRSPALLRSGSLIASQQVRARYRAGTNEVNIPDSLRWRQKDITALWESIKDEFSESTAKIRREAFAVGTAVCTTARSMIRRAPRH